MPIQESNEYTGRYYLSVQSHFQPAFPPQAPIHYWGWGDRGWATKEEAQEAKTEMDRKPWTPRIYETKRPTARVKQA